MQVLAFYGGHAVMYDIIKQIKNAMPALRVFTVNTVERWDLAQVAEKAITSERRNVLSFEFWSELRKEVGEDLMLHVSADNVWFHNRASQFLEIGIHCITGVSPGCRSDVLKTIDEKAEFTRILQKEGLRVTPADIASNLDELKNHVRSLQARNQIACVKPSVGVYGAEFWILDPSVSNYRCFSHPDDRRVNPEFYYQTVGEWKEPMLVMPYLSGFEYSVDMAIVHPGVIAAAVVREKISSNQQIFSVDKEVLDFAALLASRFSLHGIVNAQFRRDGDGNLYALEINCRPSGGMSQLGAVGANLAAWWVELMFHKKGYDVIASELSALDFPKKIKQHTCVIVQEKLKEVDV